MNDAIKAARVYAIADLQRKDAKGKLVIPTRGAYSIGMSLYSVMGEGALIRAMIPLGSSSGWKTKLAEGER